MNAALLYFPVAGGRLALSRLDEGPMALKEPIVLLTGQAVRRVTTVTGKRRSTIRRAEFCDDFLAWCFERVMTVPLPSLARIRMPSEALSRPCSLVGDDRMTCSQELCSPESRPSRRLLEARGLALKTFVASDEATHTELIDRGKGSKRSKGAAEQDRIRAWRHTDRNKHPKGGRA